MAHKRPSFLRSSISKLLSYVIIGGAFALKLPQMYKIVKSRDTTGLSEIAFYMDVGSFIPSPIYNILNGNAFSTYGEGLVVLVENVMLVFLYWSYVKPAEAPGALKKIAILVGYCVAGYGMFLLPEDLW